MRKLTGWAVVISGWALWGAEADVGLGKRLYESQCSLCHGEDGRGGRGPSLAQPRLKHATDEAALRTVIASGIAGTEMPGAWQLSPREVASVAAYVLTLGKVAEEKLPGDAARGRVVYEKQGCAGCHIVMGVGSGFGPELTDIGARRSAAYLREAVVKPGASAPEGFLWMEATTVSGHGARGVRVNEDTFTLQLKDMTGKFYTFRKGDLQELMRMVGESPMPAYEKLSPRELDDLVKYLAGLRGRP
jgi:putative heme-binding domain-containing protein